MNNQTKRILALAKIEELLTTNSEAFNGNTTEVEMYLSYLESLGLEGNFHRNCTFFNTHEHKGNVFLNCTFNKVYFEKNNVFLNCTFKNVQFQ